MTEYYNKVILICDRDYNGGVDWDSCKTLTANEFHIEELVEHERSMRNSEEEHLEFIDRHVEEDQRHMLED